MDEYHMRLDVTVYKSPILEGWYAKLLIEGGEVNDPGQQLAGRGSTAIAAVQSALGQLAAGATYQHIVLETALMHGTRRHGALTEGIARDKRRR